MKKYYISSDIEGVAGICEWSETEIGGSLYSKFAKRMTEEIVEICHGINEIEPNSEILVKDAHDSGRNIDHDLLPRNVLLNRAWSRDPHIMMNEIDNSFDASIFTGYHSGATSAGNPLSHTMNSTDIVYMKINGVVASEFLYNYYISHYYGVPVIMVTGDKALCEQVNEINPNIITVITNTGNGGSVTSKHPQVLREEMKSSVKVALTKVEACKIKMPEKFTIEISVKESKKALRASFYPGVKLINDTTFSYESENYFDVMTMFLFI